MWCSQRRKRAILFDGKTAPRLRNVLVRLPAHLVHAHSLLKPLRDELAAVGEEEAFAAAKAAHRIRHQDLPALRLRRDPRRQDHGRPEEIAVFFDRLTGVEADADRQRLALAPRKRSLEGDRALDGTGDRAELGHEGVADRLDFGAAVRLQNIASDPLVLTQHLPPPRIPKPRHHFGVADEVGEDDGAEGRSGGRFLCRRR